MNITLYHYAHCPFCVRVRMTLGALGLPYESVVIPYNDEKTPVSLSGKKMLPIIKVGDTVQNESLDIMAILDKNGKFTIPELVKSADFNELNNLLNKLGSNVHSLAMPYWIWTPEFDENSRQYFQSKKEEKRGPFKDLVRKRKDFEVPLMKDLEEVEKNLKPFYNSPEFGLFDILLASHLWGLYVVPEFQFTPKLHQYLQRVKELTHFDYHGDFWK